MSSSSSSSSRFGPSSTADQVAAHLSPHIRGKTILVTGVSPGSLGYEVVEVLGRHHPRRLILAGRDEAKMALTRDAVLRDTGDVCIRTLALDLARLESVRGAADEVVGMEGGIDVVINNAGIMAPAAQGETGEESRWTVDGFEKQFGVDHLGPFLFTNLIMSKLIGRDGKKRGGRVVVVSSDGHALQPVRFEDPNWTEPGSYNKWRAYGQAKPANALFARGLGDRLKHRGLSAFSLHPGIIQTNLGSHIAGEDWGDLMAIKKEVFENAAKIGRESTNSNTNLEAEGPGFSYKSLQQGAATHIVAAFDPSIVNQSGEYLQDCQVDPKARELFANDAEAASRLWALSEELVEQKFEY
ncbi:hypothetical protein AAFC00_006844 [Neodothiora populina]|uniref:Short-chain dehydrogenase n=1 Tax=Neodothiora populina TaxID=2781224 RepID=A0ABR3PCJ7_9PEZI